MLPYQFWGGGGGFPRDIFPLFVTLCSLLTVKGNSEVVILVKSFEAVVDLSPFFSFPYLERTIEGRGKSKVLRLLQSRSVWLVLHRNGLAYSPEASLSSAVL